jgi:hypothetical protein
MVAGGPYPALVPPLASSQRCSRPPAEVLILVVGFRDDQKLWACGDPHQKYGGDWRTIAWTVYGHIERDYGLF